MCAAAPFLAAPYLAAPYLAVTSWLVLGCTALLLLLQLELAKAGSTTQRAALQLAGHSRAALHVSSLRASLPGGACQASQQQAPCNHAMAAECLTAPGPCRRWDQPSWSKDAKAGAATGQVVTPMPGKVVKVLVANGQSVAAGQQLLVLEAMKMEHAVVAPRAGTVAGLAVRAGSQVDDGQVLLAVEPQGGGA